MRLPKMQLDEAREALKTVVSIPVTPFTRSGDVDYALYTSLTERLVGGGIRAVTPNGNTSEFYSLTAEEQRLSLDACIRGADGALVIAGVGHDARTAAEMAAYAAEQGAHAVMVHQPVHPFRSDDGWVAYHKTVADAAPGLALIPYLRDATIRGDVLSLLADACPNFVGVKYAVTNPLQFAGIVAEVGEDRLAWICGVAESWAPFFWPGGAQGFTSGLVNVTTGLSLEMQAALERGDTKQAMAIWTIVRPFEEIRARRNNANNVSAVKEAMAQLGLCEATVRPPISELPEKEQAEISRILDLLGVSAAVAA